MVRRRWVWMIGLLLLLTMGGCTVKPSWWPTTPKQDLLAARKAYSAAARGITLYRRMGAFTKSQGAVIDDTADAALEMLARWEAAIELGQPTSAVAAEWNAILLELVTKQMQGKHWYAANGEKKEGDSP